MYSCTDNCRLSMTDLKVLKEISNFTNVILVIGKADMLTAQELSQLSSRIVSQCDNNSISLLGKACPYPISDRQGQGHLQQPNSKLEALLIRHLLPDLVDLSQRHHYETFRFLGTQQGHAT